MIRHFYEQIDGWFDFRGIYEEALANASCGAVFVEVGSWYGRSAAWMAVEIANSGKQIQFYCVDTWRGSVDTPWMAAHLACVGGSAKQDFLRNIEHGGVLDFIIPLESNSVEAAQLFADNSLDFIFIDAAHDFANVRADVRAWYPKVKPGGIIAGDDATWPGVRIGVQETIPESEYELRNHANQWWHTKRRRQPGRWEFKGENLTSDLMVYIPYVNNFPLLDRAVRSVRALWSSLVVIDQSIAGVRADWTSDIAGRYRIDHGSISFTGMMNWARHEAMDRGVEFLVFMHSDAELVDQSVADSVLAFARQKFAAHCGVVFTHYDAFAVFNVAALRDVGPWDESFRWYFADNDYYYRMQLCGWKSANFGGAQVKHSASQTLHSDPQIQLAVAQEGEWTARHYEHKWGGPPGRERFVLPYNGSP